MFLLPVIAQVQVSDVVQRVKRALLETLNGVSGDAQARGVARYRRRYPGESSGRAAHRALRLRTLAARRAERDARGDAQHRAHERQRRHSPKTYDNPAHASPSSRAAVSSCSKHHLTHVRCAHCTLLLYSDHVRMHVGGA